MIRSRGGTTANLNAIPVCSPTPAKESQTDATVDDPPRLCEIIPMKMQPIAVLLMSVAFAFSIIGCQTTSQCPLHKQTAKCTTSCTMKCGDKCKTMCGPKCS